MAEGGDDNSPPVLSYEYRCESCNYVWTELSHVEIGLVCRNCRSSRIRAPDKRGTYKYKCDNCDLIWKKKNSRGGVGFCSECNNGTRIYPYRYKPDNPKRMFGEFCCSACNRSWKSGNAWEGRKQQCQACRKWNLPTSLRPLRPPRYSGQPQKPHPEENCERCQELGHSCREARSEVEETEEDIEGSVISYSNSSVVSVENREESDVTPVPSDHEPDVDIEDLVDDLEDLGFD